MRTVTAIELQKRNPSRVNIYLDDQFAFGLARITAAWIKVGQTLSEEKVAALQAEDAREVAMQQALLFLSYRPRSVEEVRKNLYKHEFAEQVIADTLARLEQAGLVGDDKFARLWVENRTAFRPRGRRALAAELRQKGIDQSVIQAVLEETTDDNELALQAARKYARRLSGLEWPEFRAKLSGHLGRRGFGYEVVAPCTRKVWQEIHPSDFAQVDDDDEIAD